MKISRFKSLFKRIRFKYKISILNENTLEEVFFVHLSKLYVFLGFCSLFLLSFLIISFLIFKTPLKKFLPGYENSSIRSEYIQTSLTVDSLEKAVELQNNYIFLLQNYVAGNLKMDSTKHIETIPQEEREKLVTEKAKKEAEYCKEFESDEEFNVSHSSSNPNSVEKYTFSAPSQGSIIKKFNTQKKHFGIDIITAKNTSVIAVQKGVVLFSYFSISEGYVIAIHHENGFISVYKNNSQLFKKIGDEVKSSEAIAITGNQGQKDIKPHLHFELWKNGEPTNPQDYILF